MSVFNLFETNFRMFFLNYFFSHKYNDSNVYFRHSDARLHVFFFFIFQNRVRFHCSFFILFRSALVWCRTYFSISSTHIIIFSFLSASVKVHSILNERKKNTNYWLPVGASFLRTRSSFARILFQTEKVYFHFCAPIKWRLRIS